MFYHSFNQATILWHRLLQHIVLSGVSTLLAVMIGVPLAIMAKKWNRLHVFVIGLTNILQTIPSLAILAFFLPILGIGLKPALITLMAYALLPIVRNTITGLHTLQPSMLDAADSLGFSRFQRLRLIELPLALPVIIAGIRTSAAMSIGISTVAAFVGAGGLGVFIYQGISMNNNGLILLGAIPVAILALAVDFGIVLLNKAIESGRHRRWKKSRVLSGIAISLALLLFAMNVTYCQRYDANVIRIGSKDFTEQMILAELMAQLIEKDSTLKVIRRFNLGGSMICHHALMRGEIDMYPEYTGVGYRVILKHRQKADAKKVLQRVRKEYAQKFGLVWLKPFGFENSNVLLVRPAMAAKLSAPTISALVPLASKLSVAAPMAAMQRIDGLLGLTHAYHLRFRTIKLMSPMLTYDALIHGQVNVILGFTTDSRIDLYRLVSLKDDKHFFPPYDAVPIIRRTVLKSHPELSSILNHLAGRIDEATMRRLNDEVTIHHKSIAAVARAFLQGQY